MAFGAIELRMGAKLREMWRKFTMFWFLDVGASRDVAFYADFWAIIKRSAMFLGVRMTTNAFAR